MNKKLIFPAIALILVAGLTIKSLSRAYADNTDNNFPPMIQGLIDKFGLNKDEVKTYIDEQKQVMMEERKKDLEEKLSTAVSEGKLTEDQKDSLLQKIQEYSNNKEYFSGKTREEVRAAMDTHREEMQKWAEENGINLSELNLGRWGFGFGGLGGKGSGFGDGSSRGGGFRNGDCPNISQ